MIFVTDPFCEPMKALLRVASAAGESIPSFKHCQEVNAIYEKLISAQQYQFIDAMWLPATETDAFSRRNLKNPSIRQWTKVNSPTFTAGRGWKSSGATNYLNMQWNPFLNGVNFTQNTHSFYVWNFEDAANAGVNFGGQTTVSAQFGGVRFRTSTNGVLKRPQVECATGEIGMTAVDQNLGAGFMVRRLAGSGSGSVEFYRAALQLGTSASAAVHLPNLDLFCCAQNLTGSPNGYCSNNTSCVIVGGSQLTAQVVDGAISQYMANY